MIRASRFVFVKPPRVVVISLVIAEVTAFALSFRSVSAGDIPTPVLLSYGALYDGAVARGEFYRFFAYALLHADLLHLLTNLISLAMLGPFLEARLKSSNFLVIYVASVLAAGAASYWGHQGHFVSVGASGGLFGLLGSLTALWVLRKPQASPSFLFVNLAFNLALALKFSNIDHLAHAGGFIGGALVTFVLDGVARFNDLWLRCKFPDELNLNVVLLAAASAFALTRFDTAIKWASLAFPRDLIVAALAGCALIVALIKVFDLVLALRRGFALLVLLLALANAALIWEFAGLFAAPLAALCRAAVALTPRLPDSLCAHPTGLPAAAAGLMILLTLIFNARDFARSLRDRGFVAAGFVGERKRSDGLSERRKRGGEGAAAVGP